MLSNMFMILPRTARVGPTPKHPTTYRMSVFAVAAPHIAAALDQLDATSHSVQLNGALQSSHGRTMPERVEDAHSRNLGNAAKKT